MDKKFVKRMFLIGAVLPWLGFKYLGFELSKILFLSFWVGFGLIKLFFNKDHLRKIDRKMLVLWLLLIFGMFFVSVGRLDSVKYVWGEPGRWQGLWFFGLLFLLYVEISLYLYKTGVEMAWLIGALGTVIIGLWQKALMIKGEYVLSYAGRIISSVGQPNFWADYLVVGWVLIWFNDKFSKKIKSLSLVVILVGLMLSESRFGLLVFIGLMLYWLKLSKLIVGGGVSLMLWFSLRIGWWSDRLAIWQRVVEKIRLQPWFGYGLGNLYDVIGGVNLLRTDRSHNVLFDMWLIGGIGLFLVFLGLWFRGVLLAFKNGKREIGLALVVWMVLASVHVVGVLNWVWFVVLLALSSVERYELEKSSAWQILVAVFYGLMVLFGVLRGYSLV